MPAELRDRYQYFTQAELARLRQVGWKESGTPLEVAVREYVVSYLVPGACLSATSA